MCPTLKLCRSVVSVVQWMTAIPCLNSLNTLKLATYSSRVHPVDNTFMQKILNEIHAGDISLQHLLLLGDEDGKFPKVDQLIDVISKLRRLKSLWLFRMLGLQNTQIFALCQQLNELSELHSHCRETKSS